MNMKAKEIFNRAKIEVVYSIDNLYSLTVSENQFRKDISEIHISFYRREEYMYVPYLSLNWYSIVVQHDVVKMEDVFASFLLGFGFLNTLEETVDELGTGE